MLKIYVLNGPNLNMLGKRSPEHYGKLSLQQLESELVLYGEEINIDVICYQTNSECDFIEQIHLLHDVSDVGVIINAGAWTHYNYAVRDALEILTCPKVEVHLSNIEARERFRQISVIRDVVDTHFQGEAERSYIKAIDYIKGVLL